MWNCGELKVKDCHMEKKLHPLLVLLACVVTICCSAETLVMGKAGSGEDPHSFYNPTDWVRADGTVVNSSPVPGNDYVVANGYVMNVNVSTNFAGDSLQFGYVGGSKGVFFQTSHNKTVTINRLILANGLYRVWQNPGNASMSYLKGSIEVLSPATAPFRICPTHDSSTSPTGYDINWAAAISGDVGTGLLINRIAPEKKARLVFSGNNSAYFGSIAVEGSNLTFEVSNAAALGGALETFNAEALTLDNQATFECSALAETLSAADNRGMTIKSGGAKINVPGNGKLTVEWPTVVEGDFEKSGGGELILDSVTFGDVDTVFVSEGLLVANVASWPVASKFKVKAPTVRGDDVPFLKIPVSAGNVSPSDFTVVDNFESSKFIPSTVVVVTDGDWQTAYLRTAPVIQPDEDESVVYVYAVQNREGWSDDELMHPLGDYVINAKTAGRSISFSVGAPSSLDDGVLNYSMPDNTSLTFTGDATSPAKIATWLIRQNVFTGDIRAIGQKITFLAAGNSKPTEWGSKYNESKNDIHVLRGRLYVHNNEAADSGLKMQVGMYRTMVVESELSGSGTISLQPHNPSGVSLADKTGTYVFSGTNSFQGKIHLHTAVSGTVTAGNNPQCIFRFSDERNLGPGPKSGTADVFMQAQNQGVVVLHPVGSVRVTLPNRRFYFNSGMCDVKVDDGAVFELNSPVAFRNGTTVPTVVTKVGGGVWAVGGTIELVTNDKASLIWTLNVDEGYIRADNARAFSGMTVTFAEGAGIAAKYDPEATGESAQYGMIVTDPALFTVAGGKLAVKVETGGDLMLNKSVPVLTVPASMADGVEGKLSGMSDLPKGEIVFVRENVELGDAQYVRFSAEIRRGTVVVVR